MCLFERSPESYPLTYNLICSFCCQCPHLNFELVADSHLQDHRFQLFSATFCTFHLGEQAYCSRKSLLSYQMIGRNLRRV